MEADDVAERARQRELVRRGYDTISVSYRSTTVRPLDRREKTSAATPDGSGS
jgi:hypothetical protein